MHLVVKDAGHIVPDGVRVTTPAVESDGAVVEVAADIENAGPLTKTYRLDVLIVDADGAIVGTGSSPVTLLPGTRATARHRLFLDSPALWSVDAPNLHDVLLTLRDGDRVVDEEATVVGIRSLQLDPRHGLRINGETVKLRGACIHPDNGPLGAVSMRAAEERKVARLKEAGFNAIRSSHYPMSTALLDACDRLGMLVMDETFDVWTSGKSDFDYSFDFPEWWERDVEAIVAKDFNHPSVIFYSIGNEIPETGTPIGSTWGRRLAEKVRSLDPTRFVTNGVNPFVAMLDTIVPQMKARRDAAADSARRGRRGEHHDGRLRADDGPHPVLRCRHRAHRGVLRRAGCRRHQLRRRPLRARPGALPRPHHRRHRDLAELDRRQLGPRRGRHPRDRRLHLDRLGLPRRDRHRHDAIRATDRRGSDGASEATRSPAASPSSPHGAATSTSSACAGPSPTSARSCSACDRARTSRCDRPANHGIPIAVATLWSWSDCSAAGPGPDSKAGPSASRSTATRTRSSCCSTEPFARAASATTSRSAPTSKRPTARDRSWRSPTRTASRPAELSLRTAADDIVLRADVGRAELRARRHRPRLHRPRTHRRRRRVHTTSTAPVTVTIEGPAVLQALGSGNP